MNSKTIKDKTRKFYRVLAKRSSEARKDLRKLIILK